MTNEANNQNTGSMEEIFGPVISEYSRTQAIEDGILVDVSKMAKEAGITFPVAICNELFAEYVDADSRNLSGDTAGRTWDLLWMLRTAIVSGKGGSKINFSARFGNKRVYMTAICGPGDNAEPVITVDLYGCPNR